MGGGGGGGEGGGEGKGGGRKGGGGGGRGKNAEGEMEKEESGWGDGGFCEAEGAVPQAVRSTPDRVVVRAVAKGAGAGRERGAMRVRAGLGGAERRYSKR